MADGYLRYEIDEDVLNSLPSGSFKDYVERKQRTIKAVLAVGGYRAYPEGGLFDKENKEGNDQAYGNMFYDPDMKKKKINRVDELAGYFSATLMDELFEAIESRSLAEIVCLYERCSNKRSFYACDGNCLHLAAIRGDVAILRYILDQDDFDINSLNRNLQTPAFFVLRHRNIELLELLHDRGANLSHIGGHKETLMHGAAEAGHVASIRFLFSKNVDPNSKDDTGNAPLHYAVYGEHTDVVQCLMSDARVNTSIKNNDGENALHIAVKYRYFDMITLLSRTSDSLLCEENIYHQTPVDLAMVMQDQLVRDMLTQTFYSLKVRCALVIVKEPKCCTQLDSRGPVSVKSYVKNQLESHVLESKGEIGGVWSW